MPWLEISLAGCRRIGRGLERVRRDLRRGIS